MSLIHVYNSDGKPIPVTQSMLGGSVSSVDSTGNPLPGGFYNAAEVINETNPNAVTITRTVGAESWVQTITIAGAVTTVSQWVKQ